MTLRPCDSARVVEEEEEGDEEAVTVRNREGCWWLIFLREKLGKRGMAADLRNDKDRVDDWEVQRVDETETSLRFEDNAKFEEVAVMAQNAITVVSKFLTMEWRYFSK